MVVAKFWQSLGIVGGIKGEGTLAARTNAMVDSS
jgi:hypothetical protein